MRGKWAAGLLVVLVLALAAGACGPDDQTGSTGGVDDPLAGRLVRLTPVAQVESPVALAPRAGTSSLYVAEITGEVEELRVPAAVLGTTTVAPGVLQVASRPVLDLTDRVVAQDEMGLLGLVFSPDGAKLYVSYSTADRTTHLVRFDMGPTAADRSTALEMLAIPQPYTDHKAGQLAFGPDGFLYMGVGDGGPANDPGDVAGNPSVLLGKVLRIDVNRPGDGLRPYAIPLDNPFAAGGGAPEIFMRGLRNPWRFSFDRATGDLWIGDVGERAMEEIDHFPRGTGAGADLGWSGYEGTRVNILARLRPGTVKPTFTYAHKGACAVIGGYVYRGTRIPDLQGAYLYTDYCAAPIRALRLNADGGVRSDRGLGIQAPPATALGEDNAGEVYVLSLEGQIFRIDPL